MTRKVCKQCTEAISDREVRYETVVYPYNPEWPLTRSDAGLFCSNGCLSSYLSDLDEHDKAKRAQAEIM